MTLAFSIARILSSTAQLVIYFLLKSILLLRSGCLRTLQMIPILYDSNTKLLRFMAPLLPNESNILGKSRPKQLQIFSLLSAYSSELQTLSVIISLSQYSGSNLKFMYNQSHPQIWNNNQTTTTEARQFFCFVCAVYFWGSPTWSSLLCFTYLCYTPDMRKRNEQVTQFIHTIFEIYRIKFLSLWSDNCGDQFKIWLGFCICSITRTASNILQFLCPRDCNSFRR